MRNDRNQFLMTSREVQQKLSAFDSAIQTMFRKTLIGAELADGELFQTIHQLCFELCTLEQEETAYSLIVNTLKTEVAQAKKFSCYALTSPQLRWFTQSKILFSPNQMLGT